MCTTSFSTPDPPPAPPPVADPPAPGALFVRPNPESRPGVQNLMEVMNQMALQSLQIPIRQVGK